MAADILARRCEHCLNDTRVFLPLHPKNKLVDIEGQQFARLIVVHFIGIAGVRKGYWCCDCTCGGHLIVIGSHLRNGNTKSCGCWQDDHPSHLSHGMTKTGEFQSWQGMIQRCTNPKMHNYSYYGARGITVCPEWLASFEAFYADMGPRPLGTSIERRDNMQGYSKDNCFWGTKVEQANNTRGNRLLTWNGETMTIAQWARRSGQKYFTLLRRLDAGWDVGQALTLPNQPSGQSSSSRKYSGESI